MLSYIVDCIIIALIHQNYVLYPMDIDITGYKTLPPYGTLWKLPLEC